MVIRPCAPAMDEATAAAVFRILDTVNDPEIPVVSIVDMGMVRGTLAEPPTVLITPTYSGCPATPFIEKSVRAALDEAGFQAVAVRSILAPPWTTDWITERGRQRLHAYGIAPPSDKLGIECPRCRSLDTREVSRFGSTPCKSQWQCGDCLEPFDRFKCH
jgi:ring-1,2-phenylacetyl-CoA epoxidase subunit PaaD